MQENVTTKITNHHEARNPQSRGRMDVGREMLLHNYWKAINASVGKCSSRAGLRWSWAPPPRNPNPALGLATRHRSWSRYALLRRDELTELLLFLFLPFRQYEKLLCLSWSPPGCRICPSALCGAAGGGMGLSITWHCCISPLVQPGLDAFVRLWHNVGLLCVLASSVWGEDGNWIKKEQAVPAFSARYLGVSRRGGQSDD